jgi:U3 small nucleolar ribonucleoprotein protein IMP4
MLRKNVRLRKEYLFKKALEERERTTSDNKRKLRDALENNAPIPTEIRGADRKLRKVLDLDDDRTKERYNPEDDEYRYTGVKDPRIMITTSRDPSTRLVSFLKELRLVLPGAERVNRGGYVIKDLVELCRSHDVTDLVILHEHRGEPDGLIVSHMPHGPTAYFGLKNVVLRHDLPEKPPNMSEANPHLIFHDFSGKVGKRVQDILTALFPPPNPLGQRVLTFANERDTIHFRHHLWKETPEFVKVQDAARKRECVELSEVGPRFDLRLYRIELGTVEMKDVQTEWVLRPYFNKQSRAIGE